MNEKGEFTYKGKFCGIVYDNKKIYVAVYEDSERLLTEKLEYLFPVSKFSKGQQLVAFHVANLHVLPNLAINRI